MLVVVHEAEFCTFCNFVMLFFDVLHHTDEPYNLLKTKAFTIFISDCLSCNCEEQLPSPTVGRLLVICRLTVGNLSADCWWSVGRLLADSWPTVDQHLTDVDQQIYLDFSEKITSCRTSVGQQSTDWRLTVGDMSVRCWQSVGRMLVTSCRLLSRKVYDL